MHGNDKERAQEVDHLYGGGGIEGGSASDRNEQHIGITYIIHLGRRGDMTQVTEMTYLHIIDLDEVGGVLPALLSFFGVMEGPDPVDKNSPDLVFTGTCDYSGGTLYTADEIMPRVVVAYGDDIGC